MRTEFWQETINQAPFGYACHQLLTGSDGEPEDYVFLEVNPAFENMTGLCSAAILGKRVTEVLPGIRDGGFDWVAFYGKVALTGERQEFTQYARPLQRTFKITALSHEKGYFITLFQEVTEETQRIRHLENQQKMILDLSRELDLVFNGTHDAMFLLKADSDQQFRCMRVNATYRKLVGYSLVEIVGKTAVEAMGAELGAVVEAGYQKCLTAKEQVTYEETLAFPAGVRTWLTTLTPVVEAGQVIYLIGSRQDITGLRTAEAEQTRLSRRLQAMFQEHAAIMLLIEPNSGTIVDANPAACAFYGYSREELLSMHIQDINQLPAAEVEKRRLEALNRGREYFLFPHRMKSGEIRLVDVYSCPLTDNTGPLLFSIIFDVTEREKYRASLQQEKELLRTTLYSIGDGVVTTDAEGRISSVNDAAQVISGWTEQEAAGKHFAEVFRLISEETAGPVDDPVRKVLQTGKTIGLANHTALITKDGQLVSLADSAAPIKDEKGRTLGVVMVFRDVTAEKAQQERITYLSYNDQLTGLNNRRFLEEELGRLDTPHMLPLAVIMGDLNGLKLTNDIFGHAAGDGLLKAASQAIKNSCRPGDIVIRWGGDEFVILLPQTDAKLAEEILMKIKGKCDAHHVGQLQLSISLGYAVKTRSEEDIWQMLKEAEELMYRQKLLEGRSYRNSIINTLQATMLVKSHETEDHSNRLKQHSLHIGKVLGLTEKALDELALLAVLHDIGKVGVNESILQKPGPLTEAEWVEMKKHPEIGYRITQNTPELSVVSEFILTHHERWDGKGYPRGLRGSSIPQLSRILAVVDAYDAMVNDRVYRPAMEKEQALAELSRNAGKQFDPEVVAVFLANAY